MLGAILKSVAVLIALYAGYLLYESKLTEQLDFEVKETSDSGIELREYAPFIVAEVVVQAADAREAANKGFRPLAGYIFGGNTPNEKISMTAPVTTQPTDGGEKISMTAPVTTSESSENGSYTVQFSMPAGLTMETLPEPVDDNVRLVEKPAHLRLAKTFRGDPQPSEIVEAEQELTQHAENAGHTITGKPIWAGYSSPMVPKPIRKWEVMLPVDTKAES